MKSDLLRKIIEGALMEQLMNKQPLTVYVFYNGTLRTFQSLDPFELR